MKNICRLFTHRNQSRLLWPRSFSVCCEPHGLRHNRRFAMKFRLLGTKFSSFLNKSSSYPRRIKWLTSKRMTTSHELRRHILLSAHELDYELMRKHCFYLDQKLFHCGDVTYLFVSDGELVYFVSFPFPCLFVCFFPVPLFTSALTLNSTWDVPPTSGQSSSLIVAPTWNVATC